MGKRDRIEVPWTAADGYVGSKRPQSLKVDPSDYRGMSREQLTEALHEDVEADFRMKVTAEPTDIDAAVDEIIAWLEANPEDEA